RFLTEHGIEVHTQIVLCPGINDGKILQKTLDDLRALFPGVRSTAVVPLGLTKHREGLTPLQPVTDAYAQKFVPEIQAYQERFLKEIGTRFVFASDEFLLRGGFEIPEESYYEDYPQLEDGVGMVRLMLENVKEVVPRLPKQLKAPRHLTWVTGQLAGPILQDAVIPHLKKIPNLTVHLLPVRNTFYGDSITVTGLLSGQDVYRALEEQKESGPVFLTEKLVNYDGLFLDDWKPETFERRLNRKIHFVDDYFRNLPDRLKELEL
ncbi:MAG: DUF512 domain-containing protein, partial [Calditrichaeota bacterium]|nr:DUF512 domain-containing protein [Calditrichota bacterium]